MHNLSKQREAQLFIQLRRTGDPGAREQLVRRYLPLARHTARRFARNSDSAEDLFQVASYALVKAVDGFDPTRGLAFTSYAIPTISGELKRYARDNGWGMRVARGLQERVLEVEKTISALTAEEGHSPSPKRIAAELRITTEQVLEAIEAGRNHSLESLDAPLSWDGESATRIDTVGGDDARYGLVEDIHTVAPAIRGLPERERTLLSLRFRDELPQSEIARRLGVSQMHVSRLLRRTLDDLANEIDAPALAG